MWDAYRSRLIEILVEKKTIKQIKLIRMKFSPIGLAVEGCGRLRGESFYMRILVV